MPSPCSIEELQKNLITLPLSALKGEKVTLQVELLL